MPVNPTTAPGVICHDVPTLPFPTWPQLFSPQHDAVPSVSRAHVCIPPAASAVTPDRPGTVTAIGSLSDCVPGPTSPNELLPQQRAVWSASSAQACSPPAVIAVTFDRGFGIAPPQPAAAAPSAAIWNTIRSRFRRSIVSSLMQSTGRRRASSVAQFFAYGSQCPATFSTGSTTLDRKPPMPGNFIARMPRIGTAPRRTMSVTKLRSQVTWLGVVRAIRLKTP